MKTVTWDGLNFAEIQMAFTGRRYDGGPLCYWPGLGVAVIMAAPGEWMPLLPGQAFSVDDDGTVT